MNISQISCNYEVPSKRRTLPSTLPLDDLSVGESFAIYDLPLEDRNRIQSIVNSYKNREHKEFTCRTISLNKKNGTIEYRVWRIK